MHAVVDKTEANTADMGHSAHGPAALARPSLELILTRRLRALQLGPEWAAVGTGAAPKAHVM